MPASSVAPAVPATAIPSTAAPTSVETDPSGPITSCFDEPRNMYATIGTSTA
jgi:hypothetical protein